MRRAQDGDAHAYRELLVEVATLVKAYVRRHLRGDDSLDDVVQETLFAIHRHRHTFDPRRSFRSWMYAIARHRLIDVVRQQRRRHANLALELERLEAVQAHAAAGAASSMGPMQAALTSLSSRQREVIHLLKIEGHSVAEIATQTGLSASSVKVIAHRGYKKLRQLFGSANHED
jgi:RNA polymerase sigma factor (sigma-70 family)